MTHRNATSRSASEGEPVSYVLKWYHGSDPRYCCFVRGIRPDRFFFGEITVFAGDGGRQVNVTGSLSESDYARFLALANEIEKHASKDNSDSPWEGLLAVGPASSPRVLFKYRRSADQGTEAGSTFLKVVDLVAPYLNESHKSLD